MIIEDMILALATRLPLNEERFTDSYDVSGIVRNGDVFNVRTTKPNGLGVGHGVTILGTSSVISIVSITDSTEGWATVITSANHDFTTPVHKTVEFVNTGEPTIEAETWTILSVEDAVTFIIKMTPSTYPSPVTAGEVKTAGGDANAYNSTWPVEQVVNPHEFTVRDERSALAPDVTGATIRSNMRISGGVDLARCIEAYKAKNDEKWWMFVVPEDNFASKDRNLRTDSIQDTTAGEHYEQKRVQPMSLYVMRATPNEAVARQSSDDCQRMFRGICRSILMERFESQMGVGQQGHLHYMSDGKAFYDGAVYVHAFSWQQTCDLSERDTARVTHDVRFNSFSIEMVPSFGEGTETMQTADVQIVAPT